MGARRPERAPASRARRHRGSEGRSRPRLRADAGFRRARRTGMSRMRTFVIDTDTASDDAVAILMALADPHVRVAALTVVAGNVSLTQGALNALYTCEIAGA